MEQDLFREGVSATEMTKETYGLAYQRGFDRTVRFLISRGIGRDIANDVAQTAWTKGWERRGQLRDESALFTWINTIALNTYRCVLRSEPVYQAMPELYSKAEVNVAAIDLARILKRCCPRDRALLELQLRGDSTEEIAEEQGITKTALRIRLLRARRRARSSVERRTRPICRPCQAGTKAA
jgi:RNA polymerase sigma factor (sigma-70 family)